jgi:hypothetical protein
MVMLQNLGTTADPRFQNPAVLAPPSSGRHPHPPGAAPTFRPLFRGEAVGLLDWRCPGCDTPALVEEYNDA